MDLISVPFNTMPASIVSSILKSCLALRFSANVPGDFFFGIEFHLFVELFFLLTSFIFHFFIFVKWLVFGVTPCLFVFIARVFAFSLCLLSLCIMIWVL